MKQETSNSGFMSGTSYVEFYKDLKSHACLRFLGKTNTHRVQNYL